MSTVIKINKHKQSAEKISFIEQLRRGPVADKFFIIAVFCSILGALYLGTHLWLARRGAIEMYSNYLWLRQVHANIQYYLFFGLFILGFVIQAGPRTLGLSNKPSLITTYYSLFSLSIGMAVLLLSPYSLFANLIISSSFLIQLIIFISFQLRLSSIPSHVPFLCVSLLTFTVAPFFAITNPLVALILFFGAVGGAILGVQQVFIDSLFSGNRLHGKWLLTCFGCFLITVISANWFFSTQLFGVLSLITFLLFILGTSSWKVIYALNKTPIAIASLLGALWFVLGSITLILNRNLADFALHMWTIGWALPLVIAVSIHIMRFMSGRHTEKSNNLILFFLLWQYIPTERAFGLILDLPRIFSWLNTTIILCLVVYWLYSLIRFERIIIRRQFSLRSTEEMVEA